MLENVNCTTLALITAIIIIVILAICFVWAYSIVRKKDQIIQYKNNRIADLYEENQLLSELTDTYSSFVNNIEDAITGIKEDIKMKKKEYGVIEDTPPGEE